MIYIKSISTKFILLTLLTCAQTTESERQLSKNNDQVQEKASVNEKFEISAPEIITFENNIEVDTIEISFIKLLNNVVKNEGLTTSSFLSDVVTHAILESNSFVRITFNEDEKNEIESKLGSAQLTLWKVAYQNFNKAFSHARGRLYYGRSYLAPTIYNRARGIKNFENHEDDNRYVPSSDLSDFSKELPSGIIMP